MSEFEVTDDMVLESLERERDAYRDDVAVLTKALLQVQPAIDQPWAFDIVPAAMRYLSERGSVRPDAGLAAPPSHLSESDR